MEWEEPRRTFQGFMFSMTVILKACDLRFSKECVERTEEVQEQGFFLGGGGSSRKELLWKPCARSQYVTHRSFP